MVLSLDKSAGCMQTAQTHNSFFYMKYVMLFAFLFSGLFSGMPAQAGPTKSYLRIEQSKSTDENDLKITSFGGLVFDGNMAGHIDLTQLKSVSNGNGLTLDAGAGYVFNWDVSLYLGLGIALGYNRDSKDYIITYYPEASIVVDITDSFGLTASRKRYSNLYGQDKNIIMLGLVFR